MLNRELGDLADVVVALLVTQTRETQRRLTTTTVLLGKIDGELVDDLARVPRESSKQGTVSVHDDEAESRVGLEQLGKCLGVELVVTEVQGPGQVVKTCNTARRAERTY